MSKRINVLLTGASGGVGYEAVKQLAALKNRYNTTVFDLKTKQSEKLLSPFQDDINIVYGDITNKQNVCKAVQNTDVVIHLAALIPPVADEKPDLAEKINVGGTRNLIECIEEYAPQAFFMYSSSISVYGDRIKNPNIKLGDPLKPSMGDEYAITKIKSEQLIQQSKLNGTIFRLAAIMGKHKISKLMFHMPLNTPMEIATTADTARAFVLGMEYKAALSKRIFNLGGGPQCRILYKDFLQKAFEINGLGKLNFPEGTFAKQNFHCGYYMDGDDLNHIVDFRRDTIESFFNSMKSQTNPFQKAMASLFKLPIKKYLLKQSEPYHALQHGEKELVERFFG